MFLKVSTSSYIIASSTLLINIDSFISIEVSFSAKSSLISKNSSGLSAVGLTCLISLSCYKYCFAFPSTAVDESFSILLFLIDLCFVLNLSWASM